MKIFHKYNFTNYISQIKFTGNSYIQDYELQSIIKLQPPKLFFRSEFSPKKLNRDKIYF